MTHTDAPWPFVVGEMADRIRQHDWAATPLGPVSGWSDRLKVVVEQMLANPLVTSLVCGPERLLIYNDAAARLYGDRHPTALGRPLPDTFPEGWATVATVYARAFAGDTVQVAGLALDTRGEGVATDVFDAVLMPVREADGCPAYVYAAASEVGGRLRAEAALRESEERQAFLLTLGDAMRAQSSAEGVVETAARLLGLKLNASRVAFGEFDDEHDLVHIRRGWTAQGAEAHPATLRQSDFLGPLLDKLRTGVTVRFEDVGEPPYLRPDLEALAAIGVRAGLSVPLIADGRLVLNLMVHNHAPYRWTDAEAALARETAERTWAAMQRARSEAALRESEARFAQFAVSSSDALWIRDAATLAMEYVSPAIQTIYGVSPETILGDPKHWAALIVPEDRQGALDQLERARAGEAVTHEFRILRTSDGAFRWISNTEFSLFDEQGRVQRIGGIAQDVTEAKQAAEHQTVLLLELQHRVRNILAMIRSVADQTGDTASDVEDYRDLLEGRLRSLARVQTLLTQAANVGVDLATLIRAEVEAQEAHEGQCTLTGPELVLSPKAAEVLTLAIHELATNALKYGAFSHAAGRLAVSWQVAYPAEEPWLRLDWVETGAPAPLPPPQREGFGTILIQRRIPYELKGHGHLVLEPAGLRCRLEFPLRRRDSILETDTVTLSTTIAGGSLDMTGEADLSGCTVLVVEDDFYLARDTERAVRKAGGRVLGPAGHEDDALALLAGERPTCALVDINLGHGAEFRLAEALQDAGVPFVFVTGYDDVVIPARFDSIERLRKPTDFRQVVRATARLYAA